MKTMIASPNIALSAGLLTLALGSGCTFTSWNPFAFENEVDVVEEEQLKTVLQVAETSASAGEYQVAQRIYHTASEEYPDHLEPRLGLAGLAMQQRDYLSAQKFLEDAAKMENLTDAQRAQISMSLGRAHMYQGNHLPAQEHFLEAKAKADGLVLAYALNGLGVLYQKQGFENQARRYFEDAVKASNRYPLFVMNLIRALVGWDKRDEAQELYQQFPPTYWSEAERQMLTGLLDG